MTLVAWSQVNSLLMLQPILKLTFYPSCCQPFWGYSDKYFDTLSDNHQGSYWNSGKGYIWGYSKSVMSWFYIWYLVLIGTAIIQERTTEEVAKIQKEAAHIVMKGWIPSHFMIDKSLAERNAILQGYMDTQLLYICWLCHTVWPDAIIRVCQFHIIQAILRWVEERGHGESGKLSKKTAKRPKKHSGHGKLSLPTGAMKEILVAFRWVQRCRNTPNDRWQQAQTIFEANLQWICHSHNCADSLNVISKYFQDNWWCNEWRGGPKTVLVYKAYCWHNFCADLCTDIGLPQGQTLDGTFNTNNWTESYGGIHWTITPFRFRSLLVSVSILFLIASFSFSFPLSVQFIFWHFCSTSTFGSFVDYVRSEEVV